jgi:hypothetical protein
VSDVWVKTCRPAHDYGSTVVPGGWLACGVIAAVVGLIRRNGARAVRIDLLFEPFALAFQMMSG